MNCSFFGHSKIDITEKLYDLINKEINRAIDCGCHTFYFGGFGEFDELCYKIVSKIKNEQPVLNLRLVFCVPQERYLRKKGRFFDNNKYDEIVYLIPSFNGWYKSIYFRNCAMVDESDCIIFYAEKRENSGAYKTYKYAKQKKNKYVVNLWCELND